MICGGDLNVSKSLYTRINIWVNSILHHIDTMKVLAQYIDPNGIKNKKHHQVPIYSTGIKTCERQNGIKRWMIPDQHWNIPMLNMYIGEYMVLLNNVNIGINEPTRQQL